MTSWEFPTSDPIDLHARMTAGHITVTAARTQTATVTLSAHRPDGRNETTLAGTRIEFDQGTLSVIAPVLGELDPGGSIEAAVELPEGSSCLVETVSADVSCTGELSALDVRTSSGDVSAERVTGVTRIRTMSGDTELGKAAELTVVTASGDVTAEQVDGEISVRTTSGDVQIGEASGSRTDINATSGDISVGVTPGIGVYLDISTVSGAVDSQLEPSDEIGSTDMTLTCRTISGDVRVTRAARAREHPGAR